MAIGYHARMVKGARITLKKLQELVGDVAHGLSGDVTAARLGALDLPDDKPFAEETRRTIERLAVVTDSPAQLALLLSDLLTSPNPAGAMINFTRFVESSGASGAFLNTVTGGKPIREVLATVFGSSQYMSDIIIRNPGYLYWLIEKQAWEEETSAASYEAELRHDVANFSALESQLDAARRFHRRMLLRIGVKDLMGLTTVEATALDLSNLADALVDVVLDILWRDMAGDDDPAPGKGMAVLALGKLGGAELNYSSDIDIMFVCADGGEHTMTFYHKLARRLSAVLAETSPEGYFYRVDLRLRPDGDVGPLVNSLTSTRIYYENRGRPWEFQAMLKARVIAGDAEVGARFLSGIAALSFSTSLSYSPIEAVAGMRHRIRSNIDAGERSFNIKLMEGGIRDIEFIVQSLQLVHGAKHADLRTGNTLDGISRARKRKLLSEVEATSLTDAYRFFRLIEHRLQMMHQFKTHSIPESRDEVRLLAARVSRGPQGEFGLTAFVAALTNHLNKVRLLSDSFFEEDEMTEPATLLLVPPDNEFARDTLQRYQLADTRQALSILQGLAYGTFPHLVDRNARAAFQQLLPGLLDELSRTGDPSAALVNFANLAGASKNVGALYRVLADSSGVRRFLVTTAAAAPGLARALARNMDILDALLEDPEGILRQKITDEASFRALITASATDTAEQQSELRTAIDRRLLAAWSIDLRDQSFPAKMIAALAEMTHALVQTGFDTLLSNKKQVALFALGSYAVAEPRPASDVDLLVVSTEAQLETTTREVQRLNTLLGGFGLLKLDFRLRGEGANAPLVQSLDYYTRYFKERMAPWETVAFAKANAWAGSGEVARTFIERLMPLLHATPDRDSVRSLTELRARLESLAGDAATFDTKRVRGGRYDIEYVIALGMRQRGKPFGLDASTSQRIALLVKDGIVSVAEQKAMTAALAVAEKLDYVLALAGRSVDATYVDRTLSLLSAKIGGPINAVLADAHDAVRVVYDRVIKDLPG